MHAHRSDPRAFTIFELLAVLVVVILMMGILLPSMGRATNCGIGVVAQSNLRSLNTGSANFAGDHNDEIFSLTSADQAADILNRATRQPTAFDALNEAHEPILSQRYSHLVLMDYLTDRQPEPIAASPYDKNLIDWQEIASGYTSRNSSPFPYANGLPTKAGYDMDPIWTDPAIIQLWPFASSYQVVANAWLDDTDPQYTPSPTSPHHMIKTDSDSPLGGRKMFQVTHPSAKVFMHEEFDHFTNAKNPRYATEPTARVNLAFFDGSVRQERVNDANSAFDKNNPTAVWQQPYIPLDTFPIPNGGLGDQTPLDLRFRWTKGGLKGNDFGSSKISDSDH